MPADQGGHFFRAHADVAKLNDSVGIHDVSILLTLCRPVFRRAVVADRLNPESNRKK